jgi:SAM-dependent methyltransferase
VAHEADAEAGPASAFFREHSARLTETAVLGETLDLACGRGRHALAAADLGLTVVAIDRDHERLSTLSSRATLARTPSGQPVPVRVVEADLEGPSPPLLRAARFGAVLVFQYLHRPLMPWIASLLVPGGLLLYETFTVAQRQLGWGPRNDAYLLRSGELPLLFPALEIEVYEEGPSRDPRPAQTGRLLARRPH